jgi:hypothetical protein
MRFDCYTASIRDAKFHNVAHTLADCLEGIACKGPSIRRFGEVLNIDAGNRTAAWIGEDTTTGLIFVEGKGETSPQLAAAIREHFPDHSVPRFDVCEDYDEEGAFERLQAVVRANKGPRVKGGYVALPDNVQDGKTWAAGVRGGISYVRVYEAGKHPDRIQFNRPNWARAELEVRPHYARDKAAAATMQPIEAWGLSAWSHKVGEALTQVPINRFEPEIRKYSQDKTTRYIANTFRRHLEEMIKDGLDITRTFQAVWEEEDQFAKLTGYRGRRP